nr:immunoglobulin heavy chain junction region [Mus musculus]
CARYDFGDAMDYW